MPTGGPPTPPTTLSVALARPAATAPGRPLNQLQDAPLGQQDDPEDHCDTRCDRDDRGVHPGQREGDHRGGQQRGQQQRTGVAPSDSSPLLGQRQQGGHGRQDDDHRHTASGSEVGQQGGGGDQRESRIPVTDCASAPARIDTANEQQQRIHQCLTVASRV